MAPIKKSMCVGWHLKNSHRRQVRSCWVNKNLFQTQCAAM